MPVLVRLPAPSAVTTGSIRAVVVAALVPVVIANAPALALALALGTTMTIVMAVALFESHTSGLRSRHYAFFLCFRLVTSCTAPP